MVEVVNTVLTWLGLGLCAVLACTFVIWILVIPCINAFTAIMHGVSACVGFFTDQRAD